MNKKTVVGQVGLGKWGRNLFKNFHALPDCELRYGCDMSQAMLDSYAAEYKGPAFISDPAQMINDPELEAVVVATPAPAHYKLAKLALEAGKHVYVEKPITLDVKQAEDLVALSRKHNKKLMVGHLLLYHPAITKLKQLADQGKLGRIYYVYTQRLNLGRVRDTENAMWSLAPHDISIILHLIGQPAKSVSALGSAFIQPELEDVSFVNIRFSDGGIGHVHVSWLDPTKTRKTIIVGSRKMAVFEETANKLYLVDKGVEPGPGLKLRSGETIALAVADDQPLRLECQHFIDCIQNDRDPLSNGENGLAVLRILDAAQRSIKDGRLVNV